MGATVLHGVDAKKMRFHADLKNSRFDRIIFNFPHAGFKGQEDDMHMIKYVHYIIIVGTPGPGYPLLLSLGKSLSSHP